MRRMVLAAALCLAAFSAGASAQAKAPARHAVATAPGPDAIAPDPTVRRGVLPNGLRYALLSHAEPKGAMSILFRMQVGSIDEADDERGTAHFLEHIAFAGGHNIPAGQMEALFAGQGVAFGRDQNALTGAYDTTYRLDLPQATPANMDLSFAWMRDIADGLTIAPDAVVHERGVVAQEREATDGPSQVIGRQLRELLSPELRVTQREPIGVAATVAAMDATRLRAFYERWYRPQNAILVVVGDAPLDELEARVKTTFGSWQGKGTAPQPPPPSPTDVQRPFEVAAWPSNHQVGDQVTLCLKRKPEPHEADTVSRSRRLALRAFWQSVLNQRLGEIERRPDAPLGAASISYTDDGHEQSALCLGFSPTAGDWRAGLAAARTEVRRMLVHGPSEIEVKQAVSARLALVRYGRDHADSYPSASLSAFYMEELSHGDVTAAMTERYRAELANASITPQEVRDQFRSDWGGGGPILAVVSTAPPDLGEARAYWAKLVTTPDPGDYTPPPHQPWAYASFGPPGKLVSREVIADPGFVRLRFANGVVVNFKSAPFAKDDAIVTVSLGDGRSGLGDMNLFAATIGAQMLMKGGLGKDSFEDIRQLFPDKLWSAELSVGPGRFVLSGRTTRTDLDVQLQLLTAFLSDPGFSPAMEKDIKPSFGSLYRTYATTPFYATADALNRTILPTQSQLLLPPPRVVDRVNAGVLAATFKPVLTQAPLEVTLVGDISEADAVKALARTLGALPKRAPTLPVARNDALFVHYPATLDHTVRASFTGPTDRASVQLVWPLWVGTPQRRREERALRYVAMLLQDALRHRLRDQMGETYAPTASMVMDDASDQGAIQVFVQCSPERADQVLGVVRAVAAELAAGKIEAAELEAERKPVLAEEANRKTSISWWVYALDGSVRNPAQLDDARTWDAVYGAISLEEVRAAAKTWLAGPGLAAVATPKTASTQFDPAPGKPAPPRTLIAPLSHP
jgi:zinc protease